MTARTHDLIAFASLMTIAAAYPPAALTIPTLVTSIIGNVVGSLSPDLDQATNRLWDMLPAGNLMGRIFRKLFISHRTISHSFLGCFLYYRILEFALPKIFNPSYVDTKILLISMMIGFVMHLVGDAMTKDGIPLLFPLKVKFAFPPVRFLRVTTGSWVENWVVLPAVVVYIFYFLANYQDKLLYIVKLI